MSTTTATRHQQRVEELCGATVRAVSGERELHLRARRLYRGTRRVPIVAPHVYPPPDADFGSFRGAADGLALRVLHSDLTQHQKLAPEGTAERAVFDLLEQQRVESLVAAAWPGARLNLRHRFDDWSASFAASDLFETSSGLLLFALAQTTRARLTGEPVHAPTEDAIETTRGPLMQALGVHLAGLKRERRDQSRFATHARAVASLIADRLAALAGSDETDPDGAARQDAALAIFTLRVDMEPEPEDGITVAEHGNSRVLEQTALRYRVYTREFDEEVAAASLLRTAESRSLREQLDERVARSGLNIGRLARDFQALLSHPRPDGWDSGQEEGRIDGRRLGQLIASPSQRRLFRTEDTTWQARCQVSLLIDCSGSMKQHQANIALLADVMSRALELAGVRSEVLGYTTGAWNGGRAAKAWQRSGRPPQPGRLNELRHLVFKDAGSTWRRARLGLAALQKGELFREGIDGEAVQWACRRLREPLGGIDGGMDDTWPARRILIVVSDGSPMDTATHLANDLHYLDHHLRLVVQHEEAAGDVEILGLGVGLDLSPYYRRCQALDPTAATGHATFREILALVAGQRHR